MNVARKRTKGFSLLLNSTRKTRIANYSEAIIDTDYLQTRGFLIQDTSKILGVQKP